MPGYIPRRSKELIAALIRYFERERDNGGPLLPLTAVTEVSAYLFLLYENNNYYVVSIFTESC